MSITPQKFCPRCSAVAPIHAPKCLTCGRTFNTKFDEPDDKTIFAQNFPPPQQPYNQPPYAPQPPPYYDDRIRMIPGTHSIALAIIVCLLCPPAGYIVNKQYVKGVVVFLASVTATIVTWGFGVILVVPLMIIDCGVVAGRINRGEAVSQWQFF